MTDPFLVQLAIVFSVWMTIVFILHLLDCIGDPADRKAIPKGGGATQELSRRCDGQHEALLQGNLLVGIFGLFPPADPFREAWEVGLEPEPKQKCPESERPTQDMVWMGQKGVLGHDEQGFAVFYSDEEEKALAAVMATPPAIMRRAEVQGICDGYADKLNRQMRTWSGSRLASVRETAKGRTEIRTDFEADGKQVWLVYHDGKAVGGAYSMKEANRISDEANRRAMEASSWKTIGAPSTKWGEPGTDHWIN